MKPSHDMDPVTTSVGSGILQVRIHRPEKLNALTLAMYAALTAALESADRNEQVRVILLRGSRSCFTSGNDLMDFSRNPPEGEQSPVFRFLKTISQTRKPLVAMVSGPAVGIGTTLLLHCDLVFADETAQFKLPFVNLGLCPEAASSYLLPKLVGHLRASELLLLGETIDADHAAEIGLINGIYPHPELEKQVFAKAMKLVRQPSQSVQLTKALLKQNQTRQVAAVMSEEGQLFLQRLATPEAQDAINAFIREHNTD